MQTYAAYYDNAVREQSSSGGVFSLIAAQFEVIYGVAMTADCHSAEFQRVTGDISKLRGSKYFQAKVGNTFQLAKQDLDAGRTVLFTGTGCQINGLKMFLQKEYDNLFTIDVICHGVPSPKLWDAYASYREVQFGKKLKSVNFRCKDHGWSDFGMKANKLYISKNQDPFMQMFLRDYCLRPACYQCHAKQMKLADLTIGDFWGIESVAPEMNDGRGTSLIITRTVKGQTLFDGLKPSLHWKEVSYDEGIRHNPAEYRSPARPQQRETFFEDLSNLTFTKMEKKYASLPQIPGSVRFKQMIKKFIKRFLRGGTHKPTSLNSDYGVLYTFKDPDQKWRKNET